MGDAVAVVLAHTHVSGEPSASPPDEYLPRRVALAGDILGILLVDHVVVGQPGLVSLAEMGRLPELVLGLDSTKGVSPRRKRTRRSGSKGATVATKVASGTGATSRFGVSPIPEDAHADAR